MLTKLVHVEHQATNVQIREEKVEQESREAMRDAAIHFHPTRSKAGEPMMPPTSFGKMVDDNAHREILVD